MNTISACAVTPLANVAVNVLVDVAADVGVPVMFPFAESIVKPAGRLLPPKEGLLPVGATVKVMGVIAEPTAPFTLL